MVKKKEMAQWQHSAIEVHDQQPYRSLLFFQHIFLSERYEQSAREVIFVYYLNTPAVLSQLNCTPLITFAKISSLAEGNLALSGFESHRVSLEINCLQEQQTTVTGLVIVTERK